MQKFFPIVLHLLKQHFPMHGHLYQFYKHESIEVFSNYRMFLQEHQFQLKLFLIVLQLLKHRDF